MDESSKWRIKGGAHIALAIFVKIPQDGTVNFDKREKIE